MNKTCATLIFTIFIASLFIAGNGYATETDDITPGEKIYLNGILPSGEKLQAVLKGDISISGEQAACVNCHRKSGLGSIEGQTIALDISARTLFKDLELKARRYTKQQTDNIKLERPAYTRQTLFEALTRGTRPNGSRLASIMPIYTLSDKDYSYLYSYLKTLSAKADPGVTDKEFHIATVINDDADKGKSQTMIDILNQYIKEYNTETRFESKRVKHAPIQKEWHYTSYRKIKLHIWRVSGNHASQLEQLAGYYSKQPVFAMLSGTAESSWQAVHDFCNSNRIPCIFPSTLLPGESDDNYYSLYYSQGVTLEARVLAKHISGMQDNPANILIIHDNSDIAQTMLTAFKRTISGNISVDSIDITDSDDSHKEITHASDDIIIWGKPDQLTKLLRVASTYIRPTSRLYTSSNIINTPQAITAALKLSGNLLATYPHVTPDKLNRKLLRANVWAKSRKINISDNYILGDTFTATMILGNALRHLRGNYYRDYLLELLEHKVEKAVVSSTYPRLSTGPGQRHAIKGCAIMQVESPSSITPITDIIIPD